MQERRRRAPGLAKGLAALLTAALLAGCGALSGAKTETSAARATTTVAPTTTTTTEAPLPVTPITWTPCNGNLQCGTLTVPLNYSDPEGATIGIAVERHLAAVPSQRIGSLVINPGGPGVSGIDDFANELSVVTSGLLDDFDIVTFDPRGVERSDPVTCGEKPGAAPEAEPDPVPQSAAAQTSFISGLRQYGEQCETASASILPNVGTVNVARDLDRLRQALGDSGLTFMGQSYGTLIGELYAQMFPTHVRAMVLDSVINPALTLNQMTLGQAQGFESVLTSFFSWCATNSCPWRPAGDPTTALLAQINQSRTTPAPAGNGRTAGPGELYNAILDGLYSPSDWPTLGRALGADADGNGAAIVTMSDNYERDGSTNGSDAAAAIDCLDHPASKDLKAYSLLAAEFQASAPVFGPLLAWSESLCAVWPVAPDRTPAPVTAVGAPPILVIGTTQDPATPYAWAQSVASQLSHGVLLTRDGSSHVSYFYSACVRDDVQTYFLTGATPPIGSVCTS